MYMYQIIVLVLAILHIGSAAECATNQCGDNGFSINCKQGYKPVYETCTCCIKCEKVLGPGQSCQGARPPQSENTIYGVTYENFSYPQCGQGLYCNSSTNKCEPRNG
nr:uncharacterized protein LOC107453581 [Parasteatoda tepidariorum]